MGVIRVIYANDRKKIMGHTGKYGQIREFDRIKQKNTPYGVPGGNKIGIPVKKSKEHVPVEHQN